MGGASVRSIGSLPVGRASHFVCALLAVGSGAAALGHELLWTRRLVDVLGGSTEASARVLGVFFLGLALGAAWIAPRLVCARRPLLLFALVELGIGATALPVAWLSRLTDWIWSALGPERLASGWGALCKTLLSAVAVGPASFLMGMGLPLLVRGLSAASGDETRAGRASSLYALNTAGGALGLLAVQGWLLPGLGGRGAALSLVGLNCAVAALALGVNRPRGSGRAAGVAVEPSAARPVALEPLPGGAGSASAASFAASPRGEPVLAALSGAGVLAAEVIALRLVMLVAPTSYHAPFAVLAAVIVTLALAAAALSVAALRRALGDPGCLLALAALALTAAPACFAVAARAGLAPVPGAAAGAWGFLGRLLAFVALVFGPAFFAGGLLFPVLLSRARGPDAARAVARLLAWNGVGGLVGAELAYRVLLPGCGPYVGLGGLGALYALAAAWQSARGSARARGLAAGALAVCLAASGLGLSRLTTVNPHAGFAVVAERSGREGTLVVAEHRALGRVILVDNQYVLGSTRARADQERQAHLPLLLHPRPRAVAFIGLATGSTPGAALVHDEVERIVAIELSGEVSDLAREHFRDLNRGLHTDPRARVLIEDGRIHLASARARYDVVVGDLFLPWGAGAGRLYSVEHFQAVARALRPGGLFCQWLPAYQLTRSQLARIAHGFAQVFPGAEVFRLGLHPDRPSLGLIGRAPEATGTRAGLDWPAVVERASALRRAGRVRDPVLRHADGVALLYLGPLSDWLEHLGPAPVLTLDQIDFELEASAERLSGRAPRGYLWGDAWLRLLAEAPRAPRAAPVWVGDRLALGLRLTEWERAQRGGYVEAESLRRLIAERFPASLAEDAGADWSLWPGLGRWTRGR